MKTTSKPKVIVDARSLVDGYVEANDWRVHENANSGYSYASLARHVSGTVFARYGLETLYPEKIMKAHVDGELHLHDLYNSIVPYCAGYALKDLLLEGLHGTPDKTSSAPAKHLLTALQQAANFLCTCQSEWSGAQALASLDTYMAPFLRVNDETGEICKEMQMSRRMVKQYLQTFLHYLNAPCRAGETTFSNVTLDIKVPDDLKNVPVIIGGKRIEGLYYGDCQKEMDVFNKTFLELMLEGDADKKPLSFPIPTYNLTKDFPWDSELADLLFELTGKYGIPYFQNFVNSDIDPQDARSMCCRLRLDLKELRKHIGGLFGNAELTGSIGVVTINMPAIGYVSHDEDSFFKLLDERMDLCKEALEIKRTRCQDSMDRGLMPYSKIYVKHFENHFSTIGLIGMHECCLNFLGKGIETPEGKAFAIKVLKHMLDRTSEYQEQTGHLYNVEAVPGEGTSYRLAKADRKRWPDCHVSGVSAPYYTNSTWLPVGYTDDLIEVLDHQDDLQTLYTGGTTLHIFLGEALDGAAAKKLARFVVEHYRLPAFTITPTFSICPAHGYIKGAHTTCPMCK